MVKKGAEVSVKDGFLKEKEKETKRFLRERVRERIENYWDFYAYLFMIFPKVGEVFIRGEILGWGVTCNTLT